MSTVYDTHSVSSALPHALCHTHTNILHTKLHFECKYVQLVTSRRDIHRRQLAFLSVWKKSTYSRTLVVCSNPHMWTLTHTLTEVPRSILPSECWQDCPYWAFVSSGWAALFMEWCVRVFVFIYTSTILCESFCWVFPSYKMPCVLFLKFILFTFTLTKHFVH